MADFAATASAEALKEISTAHATQTNQIESAGPSAEALKELGNAAFASKDYAAAVDLFSQAIAAADDSNAKYFVNRSLSYAALGEWRLSAKDARQAVQLDGKYAKAHCRLAKALLELHMYPEARSAVLLAIKECGESADLKALEQGILTATGIPLRPRSSDFEVLGELGDGNFSKVYKVQLKATGAVFAIKAIERATVERMKRRHPNIHNEILMEKRALVKLAAHPAHPAIVRLHATFQDAGTLYYLMDYLGGGDLWTLLHERTPEGVLAEQVGLHWSLLPAYTLQLVDALEHMHRRGVVHRDLKPENIMLTTSGVLVLVDLGTAKDLLETDLNGPHFVGTAEYMSASTIKGVPRQSKGEGEGVQGGIGVDADLWALGVLLYQMALGITPFAAASPYCTFLRITRGRPVYPQHLPAPLEEVLRALLANDPGVRVTGCSNLSHPSGSAECLRGLSYDKLRGKAFFGRRVWPETRQRIRHYAPPGYTPEEVPIEEEGCTPSAVTVPCLHDLCLRAVARAAVTVALHTTSSGGTKPTVRWMAACSLLRLSAADRLRVMHYLERRRLLGPALLRMCYEEVPDARCLRARADSRDYLGLGRDLQGGDWSTPVHLLVIANVRCGGTPEEVQALRATVSRLNRLRPRLVVVMGELTAACAGDAGYDQQVVVVRAALSRISDSVPLVFVPGPNDVGLRPAAINTQAYRALFGADYYGFWCAGLRGIVLNSSLLLHPELDPAQSRAQEQWLEEEVEQAKLCAATVIIFCYHAWFLHSADEPDEQTNGSIGSNGTITSVPRMRWLQRLRHHKVHYLVCSLPGPEEVQQTPRRPFPRTPEGVQQAGAADEEVPEEEKEEVDEEVEEEGAPFLNEEADCEGPEQLFCRSSEEVRAVRVTEDGARQLVFARDALPTHPADLVKCFEQMQ